MTSTSSTGCGRAGRAFLLAGALLACPLCGRADASSDGVFALRNHNPFLQIYGLPTFQSAALVEPGPAAWELTLDLANHADFGETDVENFRIDGESYFLTLSMRRRISDRLELGFELPLVSHTDGFMDNAIEGWHDLLSLSNTKRRGPGNDLQFLYQRDGADIYRLESPASGLGDIKLTAAVPIRVRDDGANVSIRTSLKLPTGDADKLLGSGGADIAMGLHVSGHSTRLGRALSLSGFAGGLLPGEGDVLPGLLRDFVAFGGVSATWQATERIAVAAQVYGQGSYYDSDVEELGGSSMQLAVGMKIITRRDNLLHLAVVEDVSANATTDFALHFSILIGPDALP